MNVSTLKIPTSFLSLSCVLTSARDRTYRSQKLDYIQPLCKGIGNQSIEMGNFRSKNGCLTCRTRRVKCDETRPKCTNCSKKNRLCEWETPHGTIKDYQPESSSSRLPVTTREETNTLDSSIMNMDETEVIGLFETSEIRATSPRWNTGRTGTRTERSSVSLSSPSVAAHSPGSSLGITRPPNSVQGVSVASPALTENALENIGPYSSTGIVLTHHEALLIHHYSEFLGKWLDCTDACRQFTLDVPEKTKICPVLCYAVLSFAGRHRQDGTAESSYNKCIHLLIERLNEAAASPDETLLCAIVILRFYEQLNVSSSTGSDAERQLSGCSAIIRTSQGSHSVDPSAPTLREAAFWVYVRQCLYNATINQQSLDVDISLKVHPPPMMISTSEHPLVRLKIETAWTNQMVWNTARVVNFCYEAAHPLSDRQRRSQKWQELWDIVQSWMKERPDGFNAIYEGASHSTTAFQQIWFTADWHGMFIGSPT